MTQLSVKHLLGIKDLREDDIQLIFETADNFKTIINRPIKKVPSLRDITVANLFFENSTRTRISFELAQKRLSADIINFSSSSSSVSKGETLIDTVKNILSMKVDMVVMRHPSPGAALFLSKHIDATILNAGDGTHEHPTQALLDAYSIKETLGDVAGKKVVIVGDILHSRVALSNIYCLQKLGAEVMVCGPSTLIPRHIEQLGVKVEHNLQRGYECATAFGISSCAIGLGFKQTGGKIVTMDAYIEEKCQNPGAYKDFERTVYEQSDGYKSVKYLIEK